MSDQKTIREEKNSIELTVTGVTVVTVVVRPGWTWPGLTCYHWDGWEWTGTTQPVTAQSPGTDQRRETAAQSSEVSFNHFISSLTDILL